jgi:hypothetical protein
MTAFATWDPTARHDYMGVFSNGYLTFSNVDDSKNNNTIVVATPQSFGKFYVEMFFTNMTTQNSGANAFGLITPSYDFTGFVGQDGNSCGIALDPNGPDMVYYPGTRGFILVDPWPCTYSSIVRSAIDLTNRLYWWNADNLGWNGGSTADPATGVGGIVIDQTGPLKMAMTLYLWDGSPGMISATTNFGATPFAFAQPAGFGLWPAAPPIQVPFRAAVG